jgi:uncharacterized protein (DUF433 family)
MPEAPKIPDDDHGRLNGQRTEPLYTISEAAHLAHVSSNTVRRWLFGYTPDPRYPWYRTPPVFDGSEVGDPYVSFLQLVEIVIASDFRKVGHVRVDVVREAYENAKRISGIEYPFAHLELESLGGHIVQWLKRGGQAVSGAQAVDLPEQWSLPGLITEEIHKLDYERQLAARWYPEGKTVPIVVDPLFSSGLPTIEGRGVTVGAIRRRWKAGYLIEFIADDLDIDTTLVQRVLQYADKIAA